MNAISRPAASKPQSKLPSELSFLTKKYPGTKLLHSTLTKEGDLTTFKTHLVNKQGKTVAEVDADMTGGFIYCKVLDSSGNESIFLGSYGSKSKSHSILPDAGKLSTQKTGGINDYFKK